MSIMTEGEYRLPYDKVYLGGGGIHCSTGPLVRDPG
jgi:hypothetical protein